MQFHTIIPAPGVKLRKIIMKVPVNSNSPVPCLLPDAAHLSSSWHFSRQGASLPSVFVVKNVEGLCSNSHRWSRELPRSCGQHACGVHGDEPATWSMYDIATSVGLFFLPHASCQSSGRRESRSPNLPDTSVIHAERLSLVVRVVPN